jgi:hypothetical protein
MFASPNDFRSRSNFPSACTSHLLLEGQFGTDKLHALNRQTHYNIDLQRIKTTIEY